MIPGKVFIAASLDGFIARKNGDIQWLLDLPPDADGDYGYSDFLATVDGIVMGRGSFEKVAGFEKWPYPKPVIVLSRSMDASGLRDDLIGKVRFSSASPEELMAELEVQGWKAAYIDGGRVIQSFLRAGLIEELIVSTIPILLGDGLPLFGELDRDVRLEHQQTTAFASGLVQTRYRVCR